MAKELGKQHPVQSSNLKSIGFYHKPSIGSVASTDIIRVEFQRGASYDYTPCTVKEFQEAFVPGVVLKDWFAKLKIGKDFKQVK